MLIIGLNGSPQKDGNTMEMLKTALDAIKEQGTDTTIINVAEELNGLKNPFCFNCSTICEGNCLKGSQIFNSYQLLAKADGIIFASPVYFGTVSGQMKAFWDKTRWMRKNKMLLNVVGAAMAVGSSRFGGQETTIKAMHDIMLVHGMTIVGDGFEGYDCGHQGSCGQKPAKNDDNALKRSRILGLRVLEVARATEQLRQR